MILTLRYHYKTVWGVKLHRTTLIENLMKYAKRDSYSAFAIG